MAYSISVLAIRSNFKKLTYMNNFLILFFFWLAGTITLPAQIPLQSLLKKPPYYIKTIKLDDGNIPKSTPFVSLNQPIYLSFDDLQADDKIYVYRIKRYDAQWQASILNSSEYIDGFDSDYIEQYETSNGTLQSYTHYKLQIPNESTRITLSGNYILEVLNDEQEVIFSKAFIVYEKKIDIGISLKWSNNMTLQDQKQFIDFALYLKGLNIQNASQNLWIKIFQNNNLYTGLDFTVPNSYQANIWLYHYPQKALFDGLNEFRRFECKDLRGYNYGIFNKTLSGQHYDFYPYTAENRTYYLYYKDINGCYVINAVQALEQVQTEADYVKVHFTYNGRLNPGEHLYVSGRFNDFMPGPEDELTYQADTGIYENSQLLKQAYYDYRLIIRQANGDFCRSCIEGNFAQTENDYSILVYYKPPGARYTQVIGYGTASSSDLK